MKSTTTRIKLDWNKLIGFKHTGSRKGKPDTRAMVGSKVTVGVKVMAGLKTT
jgi:hypothetical protein